MNLNTTNKLSKYPVKPSIRIDIRELMKKELPETRRSEKIVEDCEDDDHEKSNGNLIVENINQNNKVNNVDMQIFHFLNKMKQSNNDNNEEDLNNNNNNFDNNNNEKNNRSNDSLDNLIIKNQKEMISNFYNNNNNKVSNNLKNLENLENNAVAVIEENEESGVIDKEINCKNIYNNNNNNNYNKNTNANCNLNRSATGRNIKLKIDDNDDVIIEEDF